TRPLLESLAESSAVPSDPQEDCHDKVLEELVSALRTSLTPVTTPSSASVSPMALPASYAGDAAVCGGFLLQVDLFIEMQPQKFTTERSKVAFLISLLNGNALDWARAIWNAGGAIIYSYDAFKNHFKESFSMLTAPRLASPLYWSVPNTEADQPSHLPSATSTQVQNSPLIPCFTPQTLFFLLLQIHRARSTPSS
uniref:DUF4939 domain-containing protein n=1 Tax=Sinocyclocheilus anshuiensis TaxID=1608454 RepID=A0A671M8L1_9TELE